METKEVRIVAPKFLDIQNIKGVPCMYIRYNEDTKKHEWLCLETPNNPMTWDEGKEWCNSKGGDYVTLSILKFISKRVDEINHILKANGYPLIEKNWHWSTEYYKNSWRFNMRNGNYIRGVRSRNCYIRSMIITA